MLNKAVYVSCTNPQGYVVMLHDRLCMTFTPISKPISTIFDAMGEGQKKAEALHLPFLARC